MECMPLNAEDVTLRCYVYDVALSSGRIPTRRECGQARRLSAAETAASLERLHAAHQLVLAPDGEVLMAMPFSAVPTPFLVSSGGYTAFANCGWDALGVAAMLQRNATVSTSCADCGDAIELRVTDFHVGGTAALLHFALPVRRWWESVVFT